MQTHLIEIVPDIGTEVPAEEDWSDWAVKNVKKHGWKAAGAAIIAAPVMPAALGAVAVGAGLVSGVQNGVSWLRGSDTIEKVQIGQTATLHDEQGLPVQVGQRYAVHPDESRSHLVILASDFYNVVISEQIADLVAYIRSVSRAESIEIEVSSEKSGGGNFLSNFGFGAKAEAGVVKQHSVELEYEEPELVALEESPFWLTLFPEVAAAFRGAKRELSSVAFPSTPLSA